MEDPIFEPWSLPPDVEHAPASAIHRRELGSETVAFLRMAAIPRLHAIDRRLRLARHRTAIADLLDEPPRVVRFELRPWPGPLARSASSRSAMLEIGLQSDAEERVTAWLWLDRQNEAPQATMSVAQAKLDASWIERVIVDFVAKVLRRG